MKLIYQKELVILPLKISTLDFDKLILGNDFHPWAKMAMKQAKYVTMEKIINDENKGQEQYMFLDVHKQRKDGKHKY